MRGICCDLLAIITILVEQIEEKDGLHETPQTLTVFKKQVQFFKAVKDWTIDIFVLSTGQQITIISTID